MILLETTFVYHVMYQDVTIKLGKCWRREKQAICSFKGSVFPFRSIQEGEPEVEADTREAAAAPSSQVTTPTVSSNTASPVWFVYVECDGNIASDN